MRKNHSYFLKKAFKLAEKNLGKTGTNPSVGCVVVKNNRIISSGATSYGGRPHAEHNALKKRINFAGAKLYTTLEPCSHYGKTPPCTSLLIKKKISEVFFSFEDPDKRTFKKAKKILKKKYITVKKKVIKEFKNFYKDYFFNKRNEIPYITAKIALSKDFYSINKNKKWITNLKSRKYVHYLRSKYDCIMSTSKSINSDNSLLNCRLINNKLIFPDLFIVDINLKLKKKLKLLKLIKKRKTFIITSKKNYKKISEYKKKGYKIIYVSSLNNKTNFISVFKKIYLMGYSRIFVETGLIFLRSLLSNKLINNLYIFKTKEKLGKNGINNTSSDFLKKLKRIKLINKFKDNTLLMKNFNYV